MGSCGSGPTTGCGAIEADGTTWIAYGGDFGEAEHDGNFVCDGLVSADREPHPLLGELAALTQPVAVEAAGRRPAAGAATGAGSPDLADLEATWELTSTAGGSAAADLDVPAIAPAFVEGRADCPRSPPRARTGRTTLAVRFTPRRADAAVGAATAGRRRRRRSTSPDETDGRRRPAAGVGRRRGR